jgi:aminoglycoside phosphotransferase (APT) family kinase protein
VDELIDTGWDSRAWIVDRVWLDREPRRPEVAERLRAETRLMRWLAPLLPLPVPDPVVVRSEPLRVRHRLLLGRPIDPDVDAVGSALGSFLRSLHGVSTAEATRHGALHAARAQGCLAAELARMRSEVLPLLGGGAAAEGAGLLEAFAAPPPSLALIHADLGPTHILVADGAVSGIIDWTDARIGDPALDLSWLLHGTPDGFAKAVAEAYGADDAIRRRALDWHRLGPWHEVLYGIDTDDDGYVASGLAGVHARLGGA